MLATMEARPASPAPAAGPRPKVLLVEDNARLAASIRDYLQKHQVEVHVEGDGLAVAARIERLRPDLVILDLMLPGQGRPRHLPRAAPHRPHAGPHPHRQGRGHRPGAGPGDGRRRLRGEARGAARAAGADRGDPAPRAPRAGAPKEAKLAAGRLEIDAGRRSAAIAGQPIELTTGDFDILWLLASRQGSVVTRDEILRVVRGIDYDGLDRSIDARICRLRRKLHEAGGAESMIKTVRLRGTCSPGTRRGLRRGAECDGVSVFPFGRVNLPWADSGALDIGRSSSSIRVGRKEKTPAALRPARPTRPI